MDDAQEKPQTKTATRDLTQFAAPWLQAATEVAHTTGSAVFEMKNLELGLPKGLSKLKRRVDGLAKVTGSKIFAYDIRAADMEGWPVQQGHAFMAMAMRADAPYQGLDLSLLGEGLQPDYLITARELQAAGLDFPDPFTFGEDMLLPEGQVPLFLGHPLAILVYKDFDRFYVAKRIYKEKRLEIIRHGETTGPLEMEPWASFRFVRAEGEGGSTGEDLFSPVADGYVFASFEGTRVSWPKADPNGNVMERGMAHAEAIREQMQNPPDNWHVIDRKYYSPFTDGGALEPNNVNCWWNEEAKVLEVLVACQNPQKVMRDIADMVKGSKFKVDEVRGHPGYTVGYGTKDVAPYPYYGAVAAFFTEGLPVRLAYDREEMFQKAIKRHPIWMNYRIAVDRETLKFQSFVADLDLDGGGRRNYSVAITQVASGGCVGVYYFPRNDIAGVGHASRAPQSASMRGFGATEVQLGTEVIVDELAHELGVDPMDLRLANILQTGDRNCAGKVPLCHSRMKEIIEYDRALPVWADREKRKAEFEAENPAFRYGVGYAIMKKGFGNSNEAVLAAIELSAEGKIRLHHIGVEMGTGIVGSQVLRCSHWFGRPADEVATQAIDWSPLELYETMSPFVMDRAYQDKMKQDPHWVTSFSSATSATNGAFYFTHATDQAALFVRDYGLLPAAAEIWQVSREDVDQASWQDGDLVLEGKDPLTLEVLAQKAHEMGGVTGAMIHCFDRWGWAEADYDILGQKTRRQVDALAIRVAGGDWQRIERENVFYTDPMVVNSSWSRYTPMSALVELTVNRGTGEVNLLSHHTTADCGRIMVPEFVSGQIQGAIGQAVGIALYEGLPLYEGGPGTGHWNFNRYRMPRARNVGVWNHSAHFLEMSADEPYPKGVAEVALGPTVGAIANAVAHAIGSYIRELPITEDKIMEVLA